MKKCMSGSDMYIHYVDAGNGLCAMIVRENGVSNIYYVYSDHLGSLLTLTDESGNIVARQNFDAWGRYRNPDDWTYSNIPPPLQGGAGGGFALINMNGRIYDPVQGRMMSPDNYVSDAGSTQAYNRFTYANNNPLKFVDPDGNIAFVPILAAAVVGAMIGTTTYVVGMALSGNLRYADFSGFGKSMLWGAVSGAASFGIGYGFNALGKTLGGAGSFAHEALHGVAHGIVQGGISELSGGDFGSGFVSGAVGSWSASGFEATELNSNIGELAFGGFMGGVSSSLSGGNFWQGAGTGLIVTGLNHLMHEGGPGDEEKRKKLKDMKDNPPDHPDYKAPKSGPRQVLTPRGKGWIDKDGRVWVPDDHGGTHAPHWDVQNGNGKRGYRPVYPSVSTVVKVGFGALIGAGVIYTVETYGWVLLLAL